ncbi:EAL domain-containing protein [Paraglaciecola sp.]|uniref:bifunctional diguanylate cyclase/phosphodiesterase n=1 Tax=Paraglaciecola sp. TaxID=1920173 RepID=UPI0030F39526
MVTFLNKKSSLYLLPLILFLFLLMLFSFLRYYLVEREESRRLALADVVAHQVASTLEVFSADRKRALNDLIISWPDRHPNPVDWFHTHAASIKNVLPGIEDVWWISPEFTISWTIAADNRNLLLGKPVTDFGIDSNVLERQGTASSLTEFQKWLNLYALKVDPNNPQLGYVLASFDIKTTLVVMIGDLIGPQFNFSIFDGETLLLEHGTFVEDEASVSQGINFADRVWTLNLQSPYQIMQMGNLILWGGMFMSLFVCLFLYWQLRSAFKLNTSQMHYQAAGEAALDSIIVYQAAQTKDGDVTDFILVDANKVALKMLAIDLVKQNQGLLSQQLTAIGGSHVIADILAVNDSGRPFECTLHNVQDDSIQWLKLQVVKAGNGVAMTIRDITLREISQQKLLESEAKFRRLVDGLLGHFIYSINAQGEVTFISHSVEDILGYAASDFQQNLKKYTTKLPPNMTHIRQMQLQGLRTEPYVVSYQSAAQQEVNIEYSDSPVLDKQGKLIAIEGIGRDVTADLKLKEKIYYQANHDQLTGLLNRYAFDRKLQETLASLQLEQSEATLCYIDMDQFKLVNDTCGHQAGDQLLHNIANILAQTLKTSDIIARVGGDEFCMILTHTNLESAQIKVQQLLDNVASFRFFWDEKVFHVGASVGLVQMNSQYADAVNLIKAADNACYTAKNNGRNQYHVHNIKDDDVDLRQNELKILEQLQYAIEHNNFELHYQTIKPLSHPHNLFSYEILLRMVDNKGSLVSPAMFIPVAERHGLMTRVDKWVFEQTMNLLESYPAHVQALEKCAINLSGASLNSPSLLSVILQRLKQTSVPIEKLCFEITETAAVMNLVTASKMINDIRQLGCKFALDDFGAGMSSFTYLKNMNVDYVKIDGSFVRNMCNDACDMATVKAIHDIASSMGKQTIAEFVGNQQTEDSLQKMGINFAQGYAIAKPLPFIPLLSAGHRRDTAFKC